jgi:DNA replication protein DnaC
MLHEPTREKLMKLRLSAMAEAWESQSRDTSINDLTFDERLALLVDSEYLARHNRRLGRLLKDAQLRESGACIEDVDASAVRGLDKAMLRQLGTCAWVGDHLNVLATGATGVGKSYLASALGQAACRKNLRVLYRRVPRLFEELGLAKADGTYARTLAKLAQAEVLILDDLGLGTIKEVQRNDLLEVLEDRYGKSSTVVTSQLPISKWHEWIGDATAADAILDRLVHNAYKIELKGPSRRKEKNQ